MIADGLYMTSVMNGAIVALCAWQVPSIDDAHAAAFVTLTAADASHLSAETQVVQGKADTTSATLAAAATSAAVEALRAEEERAIKAKVDADTRADAVESMRMEEERQRKVDLEAAAEATAKASPATAAASAAVATVTRTTTAAAAATVEGQALRVEGEHQARVTESYFDASAARRSNAVLDHRPADASSAVESMSPPMALSGGTKVSSADDATTNTESSSILAATVAVATSAATTAADSVNLVSATASLVVPAAAVSTSASAATAEATSLSWSESTPSTSSAAAANASTSSAPVHAPSAASQDHTVVAMHGGWYECVAPSGHIYYFHPQRQLSQWDRPVEF